MEPTWMCVCGREVPGESPRCSCGRTEEESDAEKEWNWDSKLSSEIDF